MEINKQYVLFVFDKYYPCGGWLDVRFSANSIDETKEYFESYKANKDVEYPWDLQAHIVDLHSEKIVEFYSDSKWHKDKTICTLNNC